MANAKRPLLRLKTDEIVPPEEDRRIEIGVYDVLLPCRRYEVSYKVAVLGKVSPSLEFLLRLVKSVPGLSEEDAAAFFGYSRTEISYALKEALGPGFVERKDGRLWLSAAGDALFKDGDEEPTIFSVEDRRRATGFDLLAIAPQDFKPIDSVEQWLPELPIEDGESSGKVVERISERFGRFFHELSDRNDREQFQRRDLYSIDGIVPKERFQSPVRIRVFALASSPSLHEIDLTSWRPDHEVADRPQVESAAALMIDDLRVASNQLNIRAAYDTLAAFAPEFLKEFITRDGLSVNRYWREAIGRAGEPRSDRPTVPIVGPLYTESNARRLLSVLDYGLREKTEVPDFVLSMAPQTRFWGATTQQRDMLSIVRRKMGHNPTGGASDVKSVCLSAGIPPRYIERAFDEVHTSDRPKFPPSLELMIIPRVAIAAVVHAPIGASSGQAVALGLASFDQKVLAKAQSFILDRLGSFVRDDATYARYLDALGPSGQVVDVSQ